jgi:outer membrane receptor protein involved in Fe transport
MNIAKTVFLFIILFPLIAFGAEKGVTKLEDVVVTGTREAKPLKETPTTINVVKEKEIETVKPTHPSEVMNRVPGVWINSTGGEGHVTSIRQPLTTNPVYLFLEDGIPIRSTGFFNHNALYEVNMPASDRIEVIKGTGTALYGSDAIGGTINVMTKPPPLTPEVEINPEAGGYDWYRLLLSGGNTLGDDGIRLDLNGTHSGGWRERKTYDRYSSTLRWDHLFSGDANLKTIFAYSHIDQKTSGGAPLTLSDFNSRPWYNYHTFDYRKVEAFRLSTSFEKEFSNTRLLSLIPYARWNRMDLLPEWGIFSIGGNNLRGYESTTRFYSLGLLTKYRQDFDLLKSRIIIGADLDYSPGKYDERRIVVTRNTATLKYTSFTYDTNTANNYDFNANFTGISPYAHIELSPVKRLRLTLGVRYDDMSYDYTNNLSASSIRPASTKRSFSHVSPKVGATYSFTDSISTFASYNNGFRAPSSGDLFRTGGTATTAVDLKPIDVDSYDAGLRLKAGRIFKLDTSLYYMQKRNDIVTFRPATGDNQRLNAGKTEHKGVEAGLETFPVMDFTLGVSYSYAEHTYTEWRVSSTKDFNGKEISAAPRENLNVRLDYSPSFLKGGLIEVEWVRLGSYWLDDENTTKYDGHDLLNMRASYNITPRWEMYAKALNVNDKLYADRASKSGTSEALYAPGQPRTFFGGLTYHWR